VQYVLTSISPQQNRDVHSNSGLTFFICNQKEAPIPAEDSRQSSLSTKSLLGLKSFSSRKSNPICISKIQIEIIDHITSQDSAVNDQDVPNVDNQATKAMERCDTNSINFVAEVEKVGYDHPYMLCCNMLTHRCI
jgi:hypothetical protein